MATIGKYGKVEFSKCDLKFIEENFQKMTNQGIADALGLKKTIVRSMAYSLGLKRMELEYWTLDQVEFLKQNYKNIGDVEIAEIFEAEWPKNKGWTKKHIEKKRRYLCLKRTQSQIKKIHSRNKENGRFSICAKKRWETTGSNPLGTIVLWKHAGYIIPHIKTETGYVHYNRWLWQQRYGDIPKGYNVIRKLDSPPVPTLEDLELISKEEHVRRNKARYNQLPEDLKEIIKITNKITKTIKKNDRLTTQSA